MAIFVDEVDRSTFTELLSSVVEKRQLACHADCQMTDHYHAVITTAEPNLSSAIRQLNGDFASWWNVRHHHVGHVFQGRFGAQIVQDDAYLLTACRYVVLNPVRACLVENAEQWPWSSYRASAGLTPIPRYLTPETLWRLLGGGIEAPARYRSYVAAGSAAAKLPRDPVLGDDRFRQRFDRWRKAASLQVPARERAQGVSLEGMFAGAATHAARNAAILRAVAAGYPMTRVAEYLGVHPSTIRRITLLDGAAGCQSSRMRCSQT
jgi:putative transposase